MSVDANYHHQYVRHYRQQGSCQCPRSDLRHAQGTQQAADPPTTAIKNRSDARSNRPRCSSAAFQPATAWCSRKVGTSKRRPGISVCLALHAFPGASQESGPHLSGRVEKRSAPRGCSTCRNQPPMRIANVALSVPQVLSVEATPCSQGGSTCISVPHQRQVSDFSRR